jgi:alpha-ketoglutarate-dependent taurine dioxygenase
MATPELHALGTEALGADLSKLDDPTFDWIQKAFADHPVLVFRNQRLGAGDIAAFGRRFARRAFIRLSATGTRRRRLQIRPPLRLHFVRARVKVRQHLDGTLNIFHGPRCIARDGPEGQTLALAA